MIRLSANICYEVSALIILLLVFAHTNFKKSINNQRNNFFISFSIVGSLDIFFDITSTVAISNPDTYSVWIQQLIMVAFYLMQLLMPYLLYLYILSLGGRFNRTHKKTLLLRSLPFIIMIVLVLSNSFAKLFFYFDSTGQYQRGPVYLLMYLYALFYLILCMCNTFLFRRIIGKKQTRIIWEFIFVSGAAVAVQMYFNDVLLTGFGIAAAIIILLLTIQDPNNSIDNLTGLYEMNGLRETLQLQIERQQPFWTILVSLDNLKRVNHIFGMDSGDQLLIDIATKLKSIGGEENVFRFLGDRFALILFKKTDYDHALTELHTYFSVDHPIQGVDYRLSACVCNIPDHRLDSNSDQFLAFIDYFITEAKQHGPGTELTLNDKILQQFNRHRTIEEYLYTAIDEKLFDVYYQPIFSTKKQQFVCVEALIRLNHPSLGAISPAEFIPIAERSGQISKVDTCAFEKVCDFFAQHKELLRTIKYVKFNLSPADLLNPKLSDQMLSQMRESRLSPSLFQFEITETAATLYGDELFNWIGDIKRSGCGLCMDDFGSGYANLDSVVKLPFDVVKMDRSMLLSAMQSDNARILYDNVFRTLHALHFEVVAEGAEQQEEIDYLNALGVDQIQGYYYSRPLPEQDLLMLLG